MGESACGSSILLEFRSQHPSLVVHSTYSCCLSNQRPLVASTCTSTLHTCAHTYKNAYPGMPTTLTHMEMGGKDHNPSLAYLLQLFRSLPEIWSSGFGRPQAVCVPQAACISSSYPFLSFPLLAPVATKPGKNGHFRIGNSESIFLF